MGGARLLLVGGLALFAVFALSALFVALAPYFAAVTIVMAVIWWAFGEDSGPTNPPNQDDP